MGNILKYQNPSSPLLNTSYKKYEGEDLSDIETFNKNWLKYRDSQLAKQGWLDESIKNKLTWLQRNFGTSDKTVGNLVREQLFSNLDNTRELSFSDAVKDSQGRYLLTESMYSDFPGERELYEVEIGPPKPVDDWKLDYAFNGSVKGTHYPDFNTIIYGDKYQHTPIKIHERDHAMFGQYGNDNIGLKIVENIFKQEFLDNVSDKWGYYDDPDEIRARLMEMRFNNKLDPTHKYTLEEIENMRNDPNFKDDHIFNRYTNKYIEYLLNTVAQNITDPNRIDYRDPVTIAKKGSKIHIKKKNRGKFTDYCGGKVTQECIARGKKSKDPKIRKRATFADNARKWKHENGGIMIPDILRFFNGGDLYPVYGSHIRAKFAYDAGSRHPEAIGSMIPNPSRPGTVKSLSRTTVSNVNGNSDVRFQQNNISRFDDGLYNTTSITNDNGNSYIHYNFGLKNGDRYHTYIDNGEMKDYYETDYGRRLGMNNLSKPKAI